MILTQLNINIPRQAGNSSIISFLERQIRTRISAGEKPVRFGITKTGSRNYACELGVLRNGDSTSTQDIDSSIFNFAPRKIENPGQFNAVLLIPTGIGAELGGHSGDAGALARFIAASCDKLITHPNVVNASDVNELPENGLYVERQMIRRRLRRHITEADVAFDIH